MMNGLGCLRRGMGLITQPGLRQYVIVPLLINVIVMSVFIAYGIAQYEDWMAYIANSLPEWAGFLTWIIGVLAILVGVAILLYGFTIVGNVIAAPFNAILSVKVEEHLLGRPLVSNTPFGVLAVRSVAREFVKLMYYLPRLLGLLIISVIPVINVIAPVLWILFGAWMMAVQYTDYAADNNELGFSGLRQRLRGNTMDALLFGILAYVVVAIPFLNLLLIPAAVAGGTVFWVEHLRDEVPSSDHG
jgi:CysZ protein